MSYETIIYETSDRGVATITLNRPERLNAFNKPMGREFEDVWTRIRKDDDVRAVVLRAAGDRAFCTGVDVREGGWVDFTDNPFEQQDPGESLGPKQNRVWKPLICAIHGMAAGGAFYWINEADIVICSDEAVFFDPHVTYGKVSAVEPVGLLGRMPYGEILRMVLMGNDERISADTALRIGLVSEVVPRAELWDRANALATLIAQKPPVAIQGTVRAIWESREFPPAAATANALKYTMVGNPFSQIKDIGGVPKAKWTVR